MLTSRVKLYFKYSPSAFLYITLLFMSKDSIPLFLICVYDRIRDRHLNIKTIRLHFHSVKACKKGDKL